MPKLTPEQVAEATRILGSKIAGWADEAEAKMRAAGVEPEERCASCAFREGSFPNSKAAATALDAVKCIAERHPFGCHHDKGPDGLPTRLCGGFINILAAEPKPSLPATAPWPYSDERDDAALAQGEAARG